MTTYIYNMGLRFKAMAQQFPRNTALSFPGGERFGYAELDNLSDQVAGHLLRAGLKTGHVVAIFAEKHKLTYATMLAALKIGAPYVTLDTDSPPERLNRILERCQPTLLVSATDFTWNNTRTLTFADLLSPARPMSLSLIDNVTGTTPAYIMFTSGSTGFPKGVTVSHAAMLNLCHWARETFSITPADVLSGANALYFDNSVFDFTASLFNGACLTPIDRETVKQPKQLADAIKSCSLWFSVPSLLIYLTAMKALDAGSWPKMRAIIFGGEGFAKSELKKLYGLYGKQATLWNVYGPTECTCICSAYPIREKDFADMAVLAPLGLLAPNFSGLVMDESGTKQMPDGETGELFLLGPQVALGYYNDVERTRAAFAPSPLSPNINEPCYRTGDLVRRDGKTGFYHFAGRKDNQIKHMGYRIELEEIEAALAAFPEISQPAVIYIRGTGPAGKIIAFYQGSITAEDIKNQLRNTLPSYMIPHELHAMDILPKNANGKVDRKTLAANYEKNHP